MKYKVEEGQCIGCGACAAVYPETFEINDAGVSVVVSNENVDGSACDVCPVGAITTEETTEVENNAE